MASDPDTGFLARAIELAVEGVRNDRGGPFGAVVVCDGAIVGEGCNQVTSQADPTAHAEIVAIRQACARLARHELAGCTLYASCEPCPMCLAAILWSRLDGLVYAATRADAAAAGFDDDRFHRELRKPDAERELVARHVRVETGSAPFDAWRAKADRVPY